MPGQSLVTVKNRESGFRRLSKIYIGLHRVRDPRRARNREKKHIFIFHKGGFNIVNK